MRVGESLSHRERTVSSLCEVSMESLCPFLSLSVPLRAQDMLQLHRHLPSRMREINYAGLINVLWISSANSVRVFKWITIKDFQKKQCIAVTSSGALEGQAEDTVWHAAFLKLLWNTVYWYNDCCIQENTVFPLIHNKVSVDGYVMSSSFYRQA